MRVITKLICGNPGLYSNIDSNHRSRACRTNIKQFTIPHQGPKIWNCLPSSITGIISHLCRFSLIVRGL